MDSTKIIKEIKDMVSSAAKESQPKVININDCKLDRIITALKEELELDNFSDVEINRVKFVKEHGEVYVVVTSVDIDTVQHAIDSVIAHLSIKPREIQKEDLVICKKQGLTKIKITLRGD